MSIQNEVRVSFDKYLHDTGIKCRYICSRLNIDETLVSHWRRGRRELPERYLRKLINYLINHK